MLTNDSMTEDEKKQAEEERKKAEEAAKLRVEDYQLAYAIDILKGFSAISVEQAPTEAAPAEKAPAN